ncbi:MAG: hypothetical protein ACOCZP_03335 [Candidatus Hadarchaeota archaeon]
MDKRKRAVNNSELRKLKQKEGSMKILVNGLRESAGKTTTTLGLYQWFKEHGKTYPLKPFAANDYWYDHEVVQEGLKEGKLYGRDAKLLADAAGERKDKINQIHRLWGPKTIVGRGVNIGGENRAMILDRVTEKNNIRLIVNSRVSVPGKTQKLFNTAQEVKKFSNISTLNDLTKKIHQPAIENGLKEFSEGDFLIIESYSDVAMPVHLDFDVVVTVEPGRAFITKGKRFTKAYSILSEKWEPYGREIGVKKIIKSLNPKTISLQPSILDDLESIKSTYKKVFEGLRKDFLS